MPSDVVTVHCFFQWCSHVVEAPDPDDAHRLMEQHYAERHGPAIRDLAGGPTP